MPGGTYFFTLVTYNRQPLFRDVAARRLLRKAFVRCRRDRPFELDAIVLLPDHLHCIWTLPKGDADFFYPVESDQAAIHNGVAK